MIILRGVIRRLPFVLGSGRESEGKEIIDILLHIYINTDPFPRYFSIHNILPLSPLEDLYIITLSFLFPLLPIAPPPLWISLAEEWDEEGEQ